MIGSYMKCKTGINWINPKQPSEMLHKKAVLKNVSKFTGKQLCQSLFFNKVAGHSQQLY